MLFCFFNFCRKRKSRQVHEISFLKRTACSFSFVSLESSKYRTIFFLLDVQYDKLYFFSSKLERLTYQTCLTDSTVCKTTRNCAVSLVHHYRKQIEITAKQKAKRKKENHNKNENRKTRRGRRLIEWCRRGIQFLCWLKTINPIKTYCLLTDYFDMETSLDTITLSTTVFPNACSNSSL